jgi:hypothetical protein
MPPTLTISRRFRGPLTSGNGGYSAGLLARATGLPAVEVTLRLPPPLERPLEVAYDDGHWVLLDGDAVVAEARGADPDVTPPRAPGFDEALAASQQPAGWSAAVFAECFVCGTRPEHDGLEIHARPVPGRDDGIVAATWVAHEPAPEVVWAAIDCPGAYAVVGDGARGEPVLARMTARIDRVPEEGEPCVVVGWPLGRDGRKLFAGTALYGATGDVLAVSRQLWIEPRQPEA